MVRGLQQWNVERVRVWSWLIAAAVVIFGLAIARQYGESWDEQQFFKYADRALQAYSSWWQKGTIPLTGNTYDNYGPAYVMLVAVAARLLGLVMPWIPSDIRHLVYFLTFMAGLWAFHRLSQRWLSRGAALGATLLFGSQPLIWGHAFISPKDLPFLTFFMLCLVTGFHLVDSATTPSLDYQVRIGRRRLPILSIIWAIMVVGILATTPLVYSSIQHLVVAAAKGQSNFLAWAAKDIRTADPNLYVQRFFVLYLRGRAVFVAGTAVGLVLLWRQVHGVLGFVMRVAAPAVLLGVTTSIRILGPLAGLLVCAYAFYRLGHKAWPMLIIYAFIAMAAMYATWPYLWPNPLGHLVESAGVMARYPWKGQVLFDGRTYLSTGLPWNYLPMLLGIQLTEPVWPLFGAGLLLGIIQATRGNRGSQGLASLTLAWFILPVLGIVAARFAMYDNFRQVMFILPPVFIVAGFAIDQIRHPQLQVALIALVVLPGLVAGARLHPYEYIYYNSFVGGEQGASQRFELDYWGTSFREATGFLNRTAPANATVWVEGPTHLLQVYVRPDLKIYSTYEAARVEHYDFVVALNRFNLEVQSYPDAPVIHSVAREGAILAVIKKP